MQQIKIQPGRSAWILYDNVIFSFVYSCVRTALLPPFEMKLFNDLSLPAYWESIGIKQIFQFDVTEEYI